MDDMERESGQTMAEYAVVLSVITVAILMLFVALGDSAGGVIDKVTALFT